MQFGYWDPRVQRDVSAAMGSTEIIFHHVGRGQEAFIVAFGARVLPRLA